MRKSLLLVALAAPFLSMGCALVGQKQPAAATPPPLRSARPAPVQAGELSSSNAKAKLQALQEELDRDAEILEQGQR